ncbi:ribosomal protein S18-alanine N-acetyltransferase [Seleniivibrio sp.]|uniref:ribosomal protein S18-alanine N-acetyltransferase n=1 Tax=Seleniivibrio sp. TaxID=2898801 RepID=UPI0025EC7E5B|nr:ribosomal protein S18-alanine N-acetyltransferase [Seleniivibrio sp.]MCD8552972.1 ribosomal protein S18-alanine N-acetyltransferase [Seleniivibrio sp.]
MIRNAVHEDLDAILAIENSCFPRPWSRKSFENELFKVKSDFMVYECDGEVAGYIVFWYILDEAELAVIAVADKFRRKGIASRLITHCVEKHEEIEIIHLEVEKINLSAVAMYEKMGFKPNGQIKDYYGDGRHALRMSCLRTDYRGDEHA